MCFFFQPFFTVNKICVAKLTFSVGASNASLADASREIAFNVAENCLPFQTHHFPSDYCTSAAKNIGNGRKTDGQIIDKATKKPTMYIASMDIKTSSHVARPKHIAKILGKQDTHGWIYGFW